MSSFGNGAGYLSINEEHETLFNLTGNAFVDAGIATISAIVDKDFKQLTKEDLKNALDFAHNIYSVKEWRGNIHGILFPNSEICNPSTVKANPDKFKQVMLGSIENLISLTKSGSCVICGSRPGEPQIRMRVPMLGSRKTVNFFPMGQAGENICPGCSFAIQFLPLYITKVGKKALLLQSTSTYIIKLYSEEQIKKHRESITKKKLSDGFLKNEKKGINSIFDIIENITSAYKDKQNNIKNDLLQDINPCLAFYHFTNFGQTNPFEALDIYHFPNKVFHFIKEVIKLHLENEWRKIVIQGFPKKKRDDLDKAFRSYINRVYERLLKGKTITYYFIDRINYRSIGSWSLVEVYLSTVMNMNDDAIEIIKNLGDKIVKTIENTQNVKRMTSIDWAKSYRDFRTALLRLAKDWASLDNNEPLLTVDDYLRMLFQDGKNSWSEIRDLLVFRFLETAPKELLNNFVGKTKDEDENPET